MRSLAQVDVSPSSTVQLITVLNSSSEAKEDKIRGRDTLLDFQRIHFPLFFQEAHLD